MLERYLGGESALAGWKDLGEGAPTLIALAQLCGMAMISGKVDTESLSREAKAILYTARHRGILEIKGTDTAYESPSRLLTVFVEVEDQQQIRWRKAHDVQQNVRFLEGFRELCANGLVIHHLYHEFSLTSRGFQYAESLSPDGLEQLLEWAQPSRGS
jgi:hypothetical protein